MQKTPWLPRLKPWDPPHHDEDIVLAVRALELGIANQGQQKLVWRYLMYVTKASEEFADLSFRPDEAGGRRATDFAEGSKFVGLMFRKLLRPEFTPQPPAPLAPATIQKRIKERSKARARV